MADSAGAFDLLIRPRLSMRLEINPNMPMIRNKKIYVDSDNLIVADGLKDLAQNVFINDATVTGKLINAAGVTVSGSAFTLNFKSGSDGRYQGTLLNTVTLVEADSYSVQITAKSGNLQTIGKRTVQAVRYDFTN